MSLREFVREREMLLLLLAIMAFFMLAGILFEVPGPAPTDDPGGEQPRTLEQMGLEDPALDDDSRPELRGVLRTWNNQLLIGH